MSFESQLKPIVFTEEVVRELAAKGYAEGQATFQIDPDRCALLVIDMQDEFVKPGWTPYWVPEATRQIPRIKMLIEACREKGIPVIYTVFSNTHKRLDRPKAGRYLPNHYVEMGLDDAAWFTEGRVVDELAPREDDLVIHKPSYGAFYDTPLDSILKNLERDTVIICGTLTNYCCGTTARQAYERGYKVVFGEDVNATDDTSLQEPELRTLRRGFAKVMSSADICEAIDRRDE